MERTRGSRNADASGSREVAAGNPARKPRRKVKTPLPPPSPSPSGPIPTPYLAVAPSPVSSLSALRIDELAGTARSNMVLPSSFVRNSQTSSPGPSNPSPTPVSGLRIPEARRQKYAAGLLAPPTIMPGGQAALPRIQSSPAIPPQNARRRSAERVGVGGQISFVGTGPTGGGRALGARQRSEERLRDIGAVNTSIISLGQLGQILESDPTTPGESQRPPTGQGRRRRRIVRGDGEGGLQRRLTVSTREEGRALGLARGASMRRVNVWDDVPEAADPPPAFPFPTSSSNRLPPAFEAEEQAADPARATSGQTTPTGEPSQERPRSPPPTFEQAMGLAPLPAPPSIPSTPTPTTPRIDPSSPPTTPRARPPLTLSTSLPPDIHPAASTTSSPTASHYASAPSSPIESELSIDIAEDDDRDDRKAWNADLSAGYSLEDRIKRESERRKWKFKARQELAEQQQQQDHALAETSEKPHESTEIITDTSFADNVQPVVSEDRDLAPSQPKDSDQLEAEPIPEQEVPIVREIQPDLGSQDSSGTTPAIEAESRPHDSETDPAIKPSQSNRPADEVRTPSGTEDTGSSLAEPSDEMAPVSTTQPYQSPRASVATLDPPIVLHDADQAASIPAEASTQSGQATPSETQSRAGSDRIISKSPPSRKLTRGKAVRRASAKLSPIKSGSIRSKRISDPPKPLFSGPAYTAAELRAEMDDPEPVQVNFVHRLSAPNISSSNVESAEQHTPDDSRPTRDRIQSQPNIALPQHLESHPMLPHREAALKRREFPLAKMDQTKREQPPPPVSPKMPVRQTLVPSGPLIDLNEEWPMSIADVSPRPELRALAASTAELLQLLEDDVVAPVAESSAQGAAKAAAVQAVSEDLGIQSSSAHSDAILVAPKKKPPPPPPLQYRGAEGDGVQRKKSVLSSADSPITPYIPSTRPSDSSVTAVRPPPLPTRRPPPPPPVTSVFIEPNDFENPDPDPPPPAFNHPRPPPLRTHSSMTAASSVSSISEKASDFSKPVLSWRPRPRTSLGAHPRGPRPPPVPPRPWAKVVANTLDERPVPRPLGDRTLSENPMIISEVSPASPTRSLSVQDLRSQADEARSPVEYTDLDVLVSRLESSGREYEGFAQITSFLGPAKNPAATPEALATLLPGLVSVDSRRTNAAGKVKLKLSLLGVRVTKCPICLSQFREKDTAVMLPDCGHVAHEVCASRWFRENSKCFVCRVPLRASEGVI